MDRKRVIAAIIYESKIAMIYNIIEPNKMFWTLPGGRVENGENLEEAVIREALEEVNLNIKIIRYLFSRKYSDGIEHCFLGEPLDPENIKTGSDPEYKAEKQIIKKAEWKNILDVKNDIQVSIVLKHLTEIECFKYKINDGFKSDKDLVISNIEMAIEIDSQNKDYREALEEL
ncbi:MAG: NUDIX domain-containing protein [Treponema sp.]|nr:NUDIX domain-containing protein [Treponema sp.]